MALCRWSECDLYIFESSTGGIQCYVASRRRVNEPVPPSTPVGGSDEDWARFWEEYGLYNVALDACELRPIGLPDDGAMRVFSYWSDLLPYVTQLKALGYYVPDWVIEDIVQEVMVEADEKVIKFWRDREGEWWVGRVEPLFMGTFERVQGLYAIQTGAYYRNWCAMLYYPCEH